MYADTFIILFNPKLGGYINWRCCAARSRIWPGDQGEREALRHAVAVIRSSNIYIHNRIYNIYYLIYIYSINIYVYIYIYCFVRWLLAGGVPARWWWRESKKSNKPSKPTGIYENSAKTAGYPHLLTLKSQKRLFLLKSTFKNILPRLFLGIH
jgi:hypothetical protein